jgi:hypothetical protein
LAPSKGWLESRTTSQRQHRGCASCKGEQRVGDRQQRSSAVAPRRWIGKIVTPAVICSLALGLSYLGVSAMDAFQTGLNYLNLGPLAVVFRLGRDVAKTDRAHPIGSVRGRWEPARRGSGNSTRPYEQPDGVGGGSVCERERSNAVPMGT